MTKKAEKLAQPVLQFDEDCGEKAAIFCSPWLQHAIIGDSTNAQISMPQAELQRLADKHLLPLIDWVAENAYLAPGSHRLLSAVGLTGGLVAGRSVADLLVGMDRQGNATDAEQVAAPLRPFHGIFSYNPHDDSTQARWHKVLDHLAPVLVGAIGAIAGSNLYFQHLHPGTAKLTQELTKGADGLFLQQADYLADMAQSKRFNRLAGADFGLGSASGSHVIPNPFGTMMSAVRFQLGAGRKPSMLGLRRITGNRGAQSLNLYHSLNDIISWAENNIAHYGGSEWYRDNEAITRKARNALQAFDKVSPEQARAFEGYLLESISQLETVAARVKSEHGDAVGAALLEHLQKDEAFNGLLKHRFWQRGLEDEFVSLGLIDPMHPEKSATLIGDNGIISTIGKWLGSSHEVEDITRQWQDAVKARHGHGSAATSMTLTPQVAPSVIDAPMVAGVAATLGVVGLAAHQARTPTNVTPAVIPEGLPRHEAAKRAHAAAPKPSGIGAAPLNALDWLSSVLVEAPSMHRFINAAALSTSLYGGMQIANSLAGRGLRGGALKAEEVLFPALHRKLDYVWKSGKSADRWKYAAHQLLPVAFGASGTYAASSLFFRQKAVEMKQAEYLDDYTDKIAFDESESYAKGLGITSIFNTGTGFQLLPFLSYSSNLQNRHLMASGRQVATPLLGQIWSGNTSHYPLHVNRMLDLLVEYATRNPDEYPKQFEPMAQAVIGKLYPLLSAIEMQQKTDAFVDAIYAVRDQYWKAGGVPLTQQSACRVAMNQHFHHAGLEQTLRDIGLDPQLAALDNNGLSGSTARFLGAESTVRQDMEAYHSKLAARSPYPQISDVQPPARLAPAPQQRKS